MRRIGTTTIAAAWLLALPAAALAQDQQTATIDVPETVTLDRTAEVGFTFTNDADDDITDAVLSMNLQVPGGVDLDDVRIDVAVASSNDGLDGAQGAFEVSAAALSASLPEDTFTVAAGEELSATVSLTVTEGVVDESYQLEASVVGEIGGVTVSAGGFEAFELVAADEDADDVDDVEQPDRVDSGTGGAGGAADGSAWLPVGMATLGITLLAIGAVSRRAEQAG